jgi:uncharacterized membrane protein YfhO
MISSSPILFIVLCLFAILAVEVVAFAPAAPAPAPVSTTSINYQSEGTTTLQTQTQTQTQTQLQVKEKHVQALIRPSKINKIIVEEITSLNELKYFLKEDERPVVIK